MQRATAPKEATAFFFDRNKEIIKSRVNHEPNAHSIYKMKNHPNRRYNQSKEYS